MAYSLIATNLASAQGGRPQEPTLQAPIGKIIEVQGAVTIDRQAVVVVQANVAGRSSPKSGDVVYRGDVVQTGLDGKVDILFSDGTTFNILRNARIELNDFVYDPNSASNSAALNLTKGTLTFVAGNVARTGSMVLKTPVGTMGIRGTTPRVEIMDDGSVRFSTLVEEGLPAATPVPGGGGAIPGGAPAGPRQRRAAVPPSPQQDEVYNRFLRFNPRICRNC